MFRFVYSDCCWYAPVNIGSAVPNVMSPHAQEQKRNKTVRLHLPMGKNKVHMRVHTYRCTHTHVPNLKFAYELHTYIHTYTIILTTFWLSAQLIISFEKKKTFHTYFHWPFPPAGSQSGVATSPRRHRTRSLPISFICHYRSFCLHLSNTTISIIIAFNFFCMQKNRYTLQY